MTVQHHEDPRRASVVVGPEATARVRERGATAVEYALLLGLIALVVLGALMLLGVKVTSFYSSVSAGF